MGLRKLWDVRIAPHSVTWPGGRSFEVSGREYVLRGETARQARTTGVLCAHRDSAVPPFRSLLRQSWASSSATEHVDTVAELKASRAG